MKLNWRRLVGKRKVEQKKPVYEQTRWTVNLDSGAITDPGVGGGLSGWSSYSMGSYTEERKREYTTGSALLAKAISDDIRQTEVRRIKRSIEVDTMRLKKLTDE